MKLFALLSFMTFVVACQPLAAQKQRVEDCTYNGAKVSCSALKADLSTEITTAIKVDNDKNEIEILENTSDRTRIIDENREEHECSVETTAGQIMKFKLKGKELSLSLDKDTSVLKKISTSDKGINGTWSHKIVADGLLIENTFIFENDSSMKILGTCKVL